MNDTALNFARDKANVKGEKISLGKDNSLPF